MSFSIDMCAETMRNRRQVGRNVIKYINVYHRPHVSVSMDVCVKYATCHRYLSFWRYVSETWMPHTTDLCFYGGMCQIRWLPQVSAYMEARVRYTGCHRPQVSVSMEVCFIHTDCHISLSLWRYVYDYIVWGGVIYVQVYRQKVKAVRAWGLSHGYTRLITLWWGW